MQTWKLIFENHMYLVRQTHYLDLLKWALKIKPYTVPWSGKYYPTWIFLFSKLNISFFYLLWFYFAFPIFFWPYAGLQWIWSLYFRIFSQFIDYFWTVLMEALKMHLKEQVFINWFSWNFVLSNIENLRNDLSSNMCLSVFCDVLLWWRREVVRISLFNWESGLNWLIENDFPRMARNISPVKHSTLLSCPSPIFLCPVFKDLVFLNHFILHLQPLHCFPYD